MKRTEGQVDPDESGPDLEENYHEDAKVGGSQLKANILGFVLGNAALFAYNVIINAGDIYNNGVLSNYPNPSIHTTQAYSIPSSVCSLAMCLINTKRFFTYTMSAMVGVTIVSIILAICFFLKLDELNQIFYASCGCFVFLGLFSAAIFQCGMSWCSYFSPEASTWLMSGNGFCGVLAGLFRIITKASIVETDESGLPTDAFWNVNAIYFLLVAAVMVISIILVWWLSKDGYVMQHTPDPSSGASKLSEIFSMKSVYVLKVIWVQWCCQFLNFFICLTLFPAYSCFQTSFCEDYTKYQNFNGWIGVVAIMVFNVFDMVGRTLPKWVVWPSAKWCWIIVLARFAFFPIFMAGVEKEWGKLANTGWWNIFWQIPFATTNGYLGTIQYIHGCGQPGLTTDDQRKFAAFTIGFAINFGILCAMGTSQLMPAHDTDYKQTCA